MVEGVLGIHHVTAIAGDPQANLEFYTGVLGLRLVKLTVNFDDPSTYHLYYGDRSARPGTLLTFFPWPNARRGDPGLGEVASICLSVPEGTLGLWAERLGQLRIPFQGPDLRYGHERYLSFQDPDGLTLELTAHRAAASDGGWHRGPVPPSMSISGIHSVTLWHGGHEPTASFLMEALGFRLLATDGARVRLEADRGGPGTYVDLEALPNGPAGSVGRGSVHHVAFTAADDAHQGSLRAQVLARGLGPTPPVDRLYFRSVYFREPGGVLLEIATAGPGFAVDEPEDRLGTSLKLPPWLEPQRRRLEAALPKLKLPPSPAS